MRTYMQILVRREMQTKEAQTCSNATRGWAADLHRSPDGYTTRYGGGRRQNCLLSKDPPRETAPFR